MSNRPCHHCGSTSFGIGVAQTIDKRTIYPFVCDDCGAVQTQYASRKAAEAFAATWGPLPGVKTGTQAKPGLFAKAVKQREDRKCEVCGAGAAEEHHWAPRYLFDDADRWPKSFLCRPCHVRWHQTVTPNMGRMDD